MVLLFSSSCNQSTTPVIFLLITADGGDSGNSADADREDTNNEDNQHAVYCAKQPKRWMHSCCPKYRHTSLSTLLDMHCTVDDHCRHYCRLLMKKAGSPNSTRHARTDSCIQQCGPSTTTRLCLQHQHTSNNPSLALQLCAEQMSQGSFLAT